MTTQAYCVVAVNGEKQKVEKKHNINDIKTRKKRTDRIPTIQKKSVSLDVICSKT